MLNNTNSSNETNSVEISPDKNTNNDEISTSGVKKKLI